jgi:hypothetical protein
MMITFKPMRLPAAKILIIGTLALLLSACSTLRLAYDNGPALASWWLDGWLDLDRVQQAEARPVLQRWFDWHRATQLPDYAQTVAQWRRRAQGEPTAAELCAMADELRARLALTVDQSLPALAELLPLLRPAQFSHLEREQADRLARWREEYLQPQPADRRKAALERAVEQAEDFYGPLGPDQVALLAAAQARSPLDPELWLQQRVERNRLLVEGLRQSQRQPSPAARLQALRALAQRLFGPADGAYGRMRDRWQAHTCETAAALHRSATPQQRQHLDQRLASWEEDFRMLAARGAD